MFFLLGTQAVTTNAWDAAQGEPEHQLLTTTEVEQLTTLGHEIGAHSMTHADFTKLDPDAVYQEMWQSKINLQNLLGQDVISFAYPYGYYNDTVKTIAQQASYKFAVATDTGGLTIEDDHYAIFRVNIMPRDKHFEIWKKTRTWYRPRYWRKRGK